MPSEEPPHDQRQSNRADAGALEKHHAQATRYTRAKLQANATCADFKTNSLSELAEQAYMTGLGQETEAALAAAKAVEPQPEQQIQNIADLTRWLDDLGSRIHTYSLRGIALAAWEARSKTVEPERKPLTDEWIRERCDKAWVFDTVKQWVRQVEAAHGITGGQQ